MVAVAVAKQKIAHAEMNTGGINVFQPPPCIKALPLHICRITQVVLKINSILELLLCWDSESHVP